MFKSKKLILVAVMVCFAILAFNSSSVLAGPYEDFVVMRLNQIGGALKLKVVPAVTEADVPRTGQTTSYAIDGGDDGELQTGIAWTDPRFTDNGNGTVTDNFTGLIWTKTVKCPWNARSWNDALMAANSLHDGWTGDDFDGDCGLEDDSLAGDWRLPNARELLSLIDFGMHSPALPSGHPFISPGGTIPPDFFWSSTSSYDYPQVEAWAVNIGYGSMTIWDKAYGSCHVWPVRGPE